jgi:flagellar protein FlaG
MLTQRLDGASSPVIPTADRTPVAGHVVPSRGQARGAAPTPEQVDAAITAANRAMKSIDASVQFEVDPETKMTVIKVVDTASNTVLRQVPAQEMLDIARALDRMQGLLLSRKA